MYACRTNVEHWASRYCADLDRTLERSGFRLLDLPWHAFELRPYDSDHFTQRGFRKFAKAIAARLEGLGLEGPILVVADSTVDWLNDGTFDAHRKLRRAFRRRGLACETTSQSGSGFCALAHQGRDFGALLREALRCQNYANIVVVGGWNDERQGYAIERVSAAVSAFVAQWRERQ